MTPLPIKLCLPESTVGETLQTLQRIPHLIIVIWSLYGLCFYSLWSVMRLIFLKHKIISRVPLIFNAVQSCGETFQLFLLTLRAPALHGYGNRPTRIQLQSHVYKIILLPCQSIVFFRIAKQNLSFCCKKCRVCCNLPLIMCYPLDPNIFYS